MSGGVDSSVAAALLKKQGYNVTGVFMRSWQPTVSKYRNIKISSCLWKQDREDAMRVAVKIGIPLLTWDFSNEYKKEVVDYMIREYKAGRTPNPDIMCNKHIKFGLFLRKALKEGADYIATGHYVRLVKRPFSRLPLELHSESSCCLRGSLSRFARTMPASPLKARFENGLFTHHIHKAKDKNKDQSYFLWTLTQKQLNYCLFPIGDYIKSEIREMAKNFGLPTADKKDSQGVCFIGPLDIKMFLKNYIKPRVGKILGMDSTVVGRHDGVFYYTIGQRHGLDIKNGRGPYYVIKKDVKKNIIYVGNERNLARNNTLVKKINWINGGLKLPAKITVKIRYRSESIPAIISHYKSIYNLQTTNYRLFKAVTSGQSAVFYCKNELLGGGIIR